MLKLMGTKIFTILHSKFCLSKPMYPHILLFQSGHLDIQVGEHAQFYAQKFCLSKPMDPDQLVSNEAS